MMIRRQSWGYAGAARRHIFRQGVNIRKLNGRNSPSWRDCSFRLISPPMKYLSQAVIGGSSQDPQSAKKICIEKNKHLPPAALFILCKRLYGVIPSEMERERNEAEGTG